VKNDEPLPEDIEAERSLIATLGAAGALDPGSQYLDAHRAVLGIQPHHLVHPAHRAILGAIQALYGAAADIDPLALKATLERQGTLGKVGGYPSLVEILGGEEVRRPSVLVDRLVDLWRARQVIRLGQDAQQQAQGQGRDVQALISDLQARLTELNAGHASKGIRKASDLVDRVQAREAFRDANEAGGKRVWFGLPAIDESVEAAPRHVVMVAARPGVGKSAMAIQGLWKTASQGHASLLISLEMDEYEVEARLASWKTSEGHRRFRAGTYSDASVFNLSRETETLDRIHHWIHPSNVPWPTVEATIRDAVRLHRVTSVWIDHVLLVQKPNLARGANDAACWTAISRAIKRLAQELGICIVTLCQLNRSGDGGEPKLSDLKETGGWEEDANAVVMLWPKEAKASEGFQESVAVMAKVAKNRSGAGGWKRELEFRGACSQFCELERTTEAAPRRGRGL
jgi:replicative DNA helicase